MCPHISRERERKNVAGRPASRRLVRWSTVELRRDHGASLCGSAPQGVWGLNVALLYCRPHSTGRTCRFVSESRVLQATVLHVRSGPGRNSTRNTAVCTRSVRPKIASEELTLLRKTCGTKTPVSH